MISCCFYERSCYVITFYVGFFWFFLCYFGCFLFSKIKLFLVFILSYDFFVFFYFFLRLYNSLYKNKLSSFKLG